MFVKNKAVYFLQRHMVNSQIMKEIYS